MRACHLLGLIGSKASSSSLETALFDSNPRVISAAIIALGEITNSDTVPRLARFFLDCRYPHAWLVTAILPIFGSQVYGEIKEALLSEELPDEKKALLLTIIANIKPQESFRDLKMLYQTTNDLDLKVRTLRAIGNLNDLSSVKMVFDALKSPEWQIRAVSCSIIGDMSLKGAAFRLIPLLRDENWYVRRNAAGALMGLGRLGIMTLVSYLEIDDVYARDVIVQTLEERGLVDQAMRDTRSRDEGRSKEGRQLLRALVQKGYTKYLRNFTKSDPVVRELLEGGENV
jgi:HEAT repeat protein